MIFNNDTDFARELEIALKKSKIENKKIIVEFGGDWCVWSERMFKILDSSKFSSFIQDNFIFIRCCIGEEGECAYPQNLELPQVESVPFFILLNSNAELLAWQSTEGFEVYEKYYKSEKIFSFLKTWSKKNSLSPFKH